MASYKKNIFDVVCRDSDAEYGIEVSQIDLVVVEYPGTMKDAPLPQMLARFLCGICGEQELMPISTSDNLTLQQYGLVPQQVEMPPEEITPTLTVDDMVSMINYLNTDAELTAPSIL